MRHLLLLLLLLAAWRPAAADAPGVSDDQIRVGMTADLTDQQRRFLEPPYIGTRENTVQDA